MKVVDLMRPDGRVFLKSEWGPIGDEWPCVSFTKKSVGDRLRSDFRPGRDVLIYVGTTNAEMTKNPAHRARLLSAVVIQPNQVLETRKIVPRNIWENSVAQWGKDRWPHAMAVTRAATMVDDPLPSAREIIPKAYRSFSEMANRGGVVEATGEERDAVLKLPVKEIELTLSEDVSGYLDLISVVSNDLEVGVKQEVTRMASAIQNRVKTGGEAGVRINPLRSAPNISDLIMLLSSKWKNQNGACALCGGPLSARGQNPMLQASPDRIDSENGAYDDENVQITHLACNLAKNQYGDDQFFEWLDTVRGESLDSDTELV